MPFSQIDTFIDIVPKASLTTAQMRAGGRVAKISVELLRGNISLVSGAGGNMLVLPGKDGKLVVDSGLATAKIQVSEAFRSVSADPIQSVINTHWHFDHTDGNEWMHKEGASIIGQENTVARMTHEQTIPEFDGVYPPHPAAAVPTITFDCTHSLRTNGQEVLLKRYTPAHTDTDVSVYFPDSDLLHAGDTFFSSSYPFIDHNSGGSIDGMIAACRETLGLITSSTIVIGGHGRAGTYGDLVASLQMLVQSRDRVATLKQAGASFAEVIARRPTASFDEAWGNDLVSPELFTWLIYRGV